VAVVGLECPTSAVAIVEKSGWSAEYQDSYPCLSLKKMRENAALTPEVTGPMQ
jgi:hypothetical protein